MFESNLANLTAQYQSAYLLYCYKVMQYLHVMAWLTEQKEPQNQANTSEVKSKSASGVKNFAQRPNQEKPTLKSLKHLEKPNVSTIVTMGFPNGAMSAAFRVAFNDLNGVFAKNSIFGSNSDLHGEVSELLDGRVQVAKWGSKDAAVSEGELSAIRSSLNTLDGSSGLKTDGGLQFVGGKQLLGRLSKNNPLKILLNTSGINASQENATRLIAIDIGSNAYFKDYNNGGKWVRFSLERKLAHEIGHATTGISDIGNFNVRRTDIVMKNINGTRRGNYSNASSWCLTCK